MDKLYDEYYYLRWDVQDYNDAFFEKELNSKALGILYEELQAKFPHEIKER